MPQGQAHWQAHEHLEGVANYAGELNDMAPPLLRSVSDTRSVLSSSATARRRQKSAKSKSTKSSRAPDPSTIEFYEGTPTHGVLLLAKTHFLSAVYSESDIFYRKSSKKHDGFNARVHAAVDLASMQKMCKCSNFYDCYNRTDTAMIYRQSRCNPGNIRICEHI